MPSLTDWRQKRDFLDQEFRAATRSARLGRHSIGKLVRVHRKQGNEF